MKEPTRTYYDVLGVSPGAPAVVLKAAYRALAKEFHPDSGAEAAVDPERFLELQDAYAVLSDPIARNDYDSQLSVLLEAESQAAAASPAAEVAEKPLWAEVIHASPALQAIHARFMLYSGTLAAGFREAATSGRSEEELLAYAEAMEDHFLSEYFGDDQDVRALAKLLFLRCRKAAVVELNELLSANVALAPAAKRQLLAGFVQRHFSGEALLSPWLRQRFAEPQPVAEPIRRPALPPRRQRQQPRAARSAVRVLCWSCAMYFGMFFVSSVVG